jgi:hypothetical protein
MHRKEAGTLLLVPRVAKTKELCAAGIPAAAAKHVLKTCSLSGISLTHALVKATTSFKARKPGFSQ